MSQETIDAILKYLMTLNVAEEPPRDSKEYEKRVRGQFPKASTAEIAAAMATNNEFLDAQLIVERQKQSKPKA